MLFITKMNKDYRSTTCVNDSFFDICLQIHLVHEINVVKIGLTHLCHVDFSVLTLWTGLFPTEGISG